MFLHNREHSGLCVLGKGRNGFFNLIAWIIGKMFEVAPRFLSDWLAFSQEICVVWEFGTCNWVTQRKRLLPFERLLCPCKKITSSAASTSLCRRQALLGVTCHVPSKDAHPSAALPGPRCAYYLEAVPPADTAAALPPAKPWMWEPGSAVPGLGQI